MSMRCCRPQPQMTAAAAAATEGAAPARGSVLQRRGKADLVHEVVAMIEECRAEWRAEEGDPATDS
jgi:hypothetical protein